MNHPDARSIPAAGGGYHGQFRLCWKADYSTVCKWSKELGKYVPVNFKHPLAAEVYAWREKSRLEYPVMRRDGEVIAAMEEANALFNLPATVKQRGKTKSVAVERKVSA